jgi:hypothetical protein
MVALDAAFAYEDEVELPDTVRSAFLREEFDSSNEYRFTSSVARDRCLGLVRALVTVFPGTAVPCYLRLTQACSALRERVPARTTISQAYCDVAALCSVLDAITDALQPVLVTTLDVELKSAIGNALVEVLKMWLTYDWYLFLCVCGGDHGCALCAALARSMHQRLMPASSRPSADSIICLFSRRYCSSRMRSSWYVPIHCGLQDAFPVVVSRVLSGLQIRTPGGDEATAKVRLLSVCYFFPISNDERNCSVCTV